jgi:hypothetical protein
VEVLLSLYSADRLERVGAELDLVEMSDDECAETLLLLVEVEDDEIPDDEERSDWVLVGEEDEDPSQGVNSWLHILRREPRKSGR